MPSNRVNCFTFKSNGLVDDLQTPVKVAAAFDPFSDGPHPELKEYLGIWDTGATKSVISSRVVDECGLIPIGMTKVHTASDTVLSNTYFVNFFLPNKVGIARVRVTEGNMIHDVLIGMDIIRHGDFAVTNLGGKTTFSFRLPSVEEIDFVKHPPANAHKPGRNNPCPCGSGKKYKKCCALPQMW